MGSAIKILIIEDEEAIRSGLIDLFIFHGYEVDSAADGKLGLQKALNGSYAMIILDVMLPSLDGFSICEEIRKHDREQPIIMLTAKSSDEDIITGLSLGVDDYISKPFSVHELVLRVQTVLRRSRKTASVDPEIILPNGIKIDTKNLSALAVDGTKIQFTRREVELLLYLKNNSDRIVPREELLQELWGYSKSANIETRTVDIHIGKLRRKIELDPKNPNILITLRNEGYRLVLNA